MCVMSEDGGGDSLLEQLEFDLWEGQFEFVGNNNNNLPQEIVPDQQLNGGSNGYKKKKNGFRESSWCKDIANHMLQQQMNVLADNQNHSDERYTRAKQENATLQARIHMLEEQLREVEVRAEERLSEEERRHRELVARVDREKQLQVENCAIRLQTLELENNSLKEEATRCRSQADKLRLEKESLEDRLSESDNGLSSLREEVAILRDQERRHKEQQIHNQQMMEELSHEIERLRGEQKLAMDELSSREGGLSSSAHQQLQEQLTSLRQENKRLQEAHDEMQALLLTRSVEEGRSLLTENKSLAAELEAMSQDEVRGALKEQQEVNAQLRAYIDGMLLNIVENYPQLLEVKPNP